MQCLSMENSTIQKKNYYKESIKQLREIKKKCNNEKPKLLLHICCGACSCYPLIFLIDLFDITIFFSNSNIYPENEYEKRLNALKSYVKNINEIFRENIKIVEDIYDYQNFKNDLIYFKDEKEGQTRCKICIAKRFDRLFNYAKFHDYKFVSTVMTISKNKDAEFLNSLGEKMSKQFGITYFVNDFKKSGGQERGILLSKFFNVYRQDYCGCEFSLRNKKDE